MPETVPHSILRAVLAPYGAKLFRKRKPVVNYGYTSGYTGNSWHQQFPYGPKRYSIDASQGAIVRVTDKSPIPLGMQEYEFLSFFGPNNNISNWSNCRVCLSVRWGKDQRDQHLQKSNCRYYLIEALKRLRRDKKCVVCNSEKIAFAKLAVLLCSEACLQFWKHENNDKEAQFNFREALRLAGWKAER